jgi:hypothetical protein
MAAYAFLGSKKMSSVHPNSSEFLNVGTEIS